MFEFIIYVRCVHVHTRCLIIAGSQFHIVLYRTVRYRLRTYHTYRIIRVQCTTVCDGVLLLLMDVKHVCLPSHTSCSYDRSNPAPLWMLVSSFSRHTFSEPYAGSLRVLKHVDAVGSLPGAPPTH